MRYDLYSIKHCFIVLDSRILLDFFFSSRRRHTRLQGDWSSDVCSSDLVVIERLRWRRSMCAEEFVYLRARARHPVKTTLISAQQAAAYYDPDKSRAAYATRDAYLADVVDFTRREVEELARLGCTYIQIDAPQYAALLDPSIREGYRQRGSDPERLIDTCIEMDNAVIGDHPGVSFGLHICRGNNQSMFYAG